MNRISYDDRLAAATETRDRGLRRVREEPEPEGQKFPNGSRVRIADDLGDGMSHFNSGVDATVGYTYEHAFSQSWDSDSERKRHTKTYSLIIHGCSVAWYHEHQLTAIDEAAVDNDSDAG